MPNILAIETSSELASCALLSGAQVFSRESGGVRTHSQAVLPMVQELLREAGVQLAGDKTFEATNDVSDDITGVTYDDSTKVLLLGPPLRITKDNAGDYDY